MKIEVPFKAGLTVYLHITNIFFLGF